MGGFTVDIQVLWVFSIFFMFLLPFMLLIIEWDNDKKNKAE